MLVAAGALVCSGFATCRRWRAEQKAEVPVSEFTLANGMQFLLVPRPAQATVMGGWVAHVGSANERPGITGISHFFEHMMFKGSRIDRHQRLGARPGDHRRAGGAPGADPRASTPRSAARYRRGEIDDPFDRRQPHAGARAARGASSQKLVEEQRALMVKDEFDMIYTEAGASGMNAFTN